MAIWKILSDQSGQSPFVGALFQGISQGLQQSEERKLKQQILKQQQQKLKLEEDEARLQQEVVKQKLKSAMTQQQAREQFGQQLEGAFPAIPQVTPETEAGLDLPIQAGEQPDPRGALARKAFEAGVKPAELAGFGVPGFEGVGITPFQRETLGIRREGLNLMRQRLEQGGNLPKDIANRAAFEHLQANPGDFEGAAQAAASARGLIAQSTAAAGERGKTQVRGTKEFQQTEERVSEARARGAAAGRPLEGATASQVASLQTMLEETIPNIRRNLDPNFLGPVRGTDIAFAARRRIGSAAGSPVSGQEASFRTALRDSADQLLRARSGAQINEQEFQRLQALLPQATDEPQVFAAALDRFESELRALLQNKLQLGTTPRGQLQGGARGQGRLIPIQ